MSKTDLGLYLLKDKLPVKIDDFLSWGIEMKSCRQIRHDTITDKINHDNKVRISTIFLGIDHAFGGETGPILFETMVFGGKHDQYQDRYRTWDEAVNAHKNIVEMVKADFVFGYDII